MKIVSNHPIYNSAKPLVWLEIRKPIPILFWLKFYLDLNLNIQNPIQIWFPTSTLKYYLNRTWTSLGKRICRSWKILCVESSFLNIFKSIFNPLKIKNGSSVFAMWNTRVLSICVLLFFLVSFKKNSTLYFLTLIILTSTSTWHVWDSKVFWYITHIISLKATRFKTPPPLLKLHNPIKLRHKMKYSCIYAETDN